MNGTPALRALGTPSSAETSRFRSAIPPIGREALNMSKLSLAVRSPLDELARALNSFGHRHRIDTVFFDWVEMAALAISNSVDRAQYADREARYMSIVGGYSKEEARLMAEMLALLVHALERTYDSPLHTLMMKLELNSAGARKRMGQYFTPFAVSEMMAKMTLAPADKLVEEIAAKGYITMMEPACGAGGMILAVAKAMEEAGINFQKHLHVTAIDVDRVCAHMTYVQTSLVGIPAVVMQGNSLHPAAPTVHWFTPFHVLYGWSGRLRAPNAWEQAQAQEAKEDARELLAQLEAVLPAEEPAVSAPPLPDLPISPLGIRRWKIHHDDAGPTLSLP
jgi:hypothetical protein